MLNAELNPPVGLRRQGDSVFRISPPLPKGAMVAGGNRLSPTEADSGDGDRVSGGGI